MEKKKLLLVAISTGVFLVLTIGAAILVFTPKNTAVASGAVMVTPAKGTSISVAPPSYQAPAAVPDTPAIPGFSQPGSVDAVDLVRNSADVPGLKEPPEGTKPQGDDFHVNDQQEKKPETLITVPKPSVVAVPNIAPAGKAAPKPVSKPAVTTPAVSKPVAPKPVVSVSQPKPLVKVYDDFWVQTGAFSTVVRAEGVKEELASKGITSIIDNRVIDGKTMFRVRVGPYTSNNEASYWLSLIKSIDGFESSQIRQTQSQR
jgi:DedD protein